MKRVASGGVLLVAVAYVLLLLTAMGYLPDRVASHFDGSGIVNGWMPRWGFFWVALMTGLGVPAFVMGITYAIRFLPSSLLNVPNPGYWRAAENYLKACELLFHWGCGFAVASLIWSAALNGLVVLANQSAPPQLQSASVSLLSVLYVGYLLGSLVWLILCFTRQPEASKAGL